MASIKIEEQVHPRHVDADDTHNLARTATARSHDDGIYNIRSRSRARTQSISRTYTTSDEDPGLQKDSDYKKAQKFSGKTLFLLAFSSLGTIYGDIGTSPLYVYSSTFSEPPRKDDLLGVLSLILWSLLVIVCIKYICIALLADNDGEGGTFSTYALLSRYMNITNRDPREASLVKMQRWASGDLESAGRQMRKGLENSKSARALLKCIGTLAVTMVIADGVLTPAQSVLGAVQGIEVVKPSLSKGVIIGVTDAILVILFLAQPLGISKITVLFAPIIMIWLGTNAIYGIYNLVLYDASVFKAFYPYYAFDFLVRHGESGWRQLGGVLLAFTGVEALFADLGAFSAAAIRISWLGYTFPCLIFAYVGQAAHISVHPQAYQNPFFLSAPPHTIVWNLIIAILAAIVASQAIITATFQLLAQCCKLSYFPGLKIVHTSKKFHGQLYIPLANWLLMIGTILVASIYNNTTRLGNAYGVCVMFVTFFDTCMVSLVAIFIWRFSPWLVFLPWLTIACVDGTFLSSALTKVPDGAWFTLALAAILCAIFLLWRYGKEAQWFAEAEDRFPTSHLIKQTGVDLSLTEKFGGSPVNRSRGAILFFDKAGQFCAPVFSNFAAKLTMVPEVIVFFHIRPLERPEVLPEDRYTISRLAMPGAYRIVLRTGYNDDVVSNDLASNCYEQLKLYLLQEKDARRPSIHRPIDANEKRSDVVAADEVHQSTQDKIAQELATLDRAFDHNVLYVLGKESMKIKKGTSYIRKTLLSLFLWMRENCRNKMENLNIHPEKLVEIGFLKEI